MQRLKSQNQRFHGLIGKAKMDPDEKKALVREVSAGRCTSSKDLTAHEMQKAIDILEGGVKSSIDKMQAKARAIANDIGILKVVDKKMDYTALDAFVLRTCKKTSMFQLDYNELAVLVTALEKWRDSRMKRMINNCLNAV
jgi:hypothetical protein